MRSLSTNPSHYQGTFDGSESDLWGNGPVFSVYWYKIAGLIAKVTSATVEDPKFVCDY
jgi:hypothetical protein